MDSDRMESIGLPSGHGDVVEEGQVRVQRSADDFARFLAAQFLHGSVVVLLRFGEEHFQDSAFVLSSKEKADQWTMDQQIPEGAHTFFLSMLKLSMMTPMNRLSVKNAPHTMKTTK